MSSPEKDTESERHPEVVSRALGLLKKDPAEFDSSEFAACRGELLVRGLLYFLCACAYVSNIIYDIWIELTRLTICSSLWELLFWSPTSLQTLYKSFVDEASPVQGCRRGSLMRAINLAIVPIRWLNHICFGDTGIRTSGGCAIGCVSPTRGLPKSAFLWCVSDWSVGDGMSKIEHYLYETRLAVLSIAQRLRQYSLTLTGIQSKP